MSARYIAHILVYIALVAFFAALAIQFFVGDLGIAETSKKQRTIAALKADIAALEHSAVEKRAEIEKLTYDKAVIRSYALLYGMTGGIIPPNAPKGAENPAQHIMEEKAASDRAIQAQMNAAYQAEKSSFLLRHPILLILLGGIAVSVIAFFIQIRVQARKNRSRPHFA
jgi:uncharacterized membrane protein (DUF106 family)